MLETVNMKKLYHDNAMWTEYYHTMLDIAHEELKEAVKANDKDACFKAAKEFMYYQDAIGGMEADCKLLDCMM